MLDTRPTSESPKDRELLYAARDAYVEMVENFAAMAALFSAHDFDALALRTQELERNFAEPGFTSTFVMLLPPTLHKVIRLAATVALDGIRHTLSSYKEGCITEEEFLTSLTSLTHPIASNGKES